MATKKNNKALKHLDCEQAFEVKASGRDVFIEGFGNKATVDRGDEIIATDAWDLENFKRNPIILFNHGMDKLGGTPIGKAVEVKPTEEGLYLKVKLSNSSAPDIQMVRDLVEERILKAFSVGFNPKQVDTVDIDGKSVRKISKAELYEVSVVGVPMNQDSLFELSGKSLHAVKSLVLKARKAADAARVEDILGTCADRHGAQELVAKSLGIDLSVLLDMLAGDAAMDARVEKAMETAVKALNLRAALEEALTALDDGKSEEEVRAALTSALGESTDEEAEDEEAADGGEDKAPGEDEGEQTSDDEGGGSEDEGASTDDDGGGAGGDEEEDGRRKADFQECVNSTIPKLLAEGMERDQAVAAAISKCQESGKCQLTPASKTAAFDVLFTALDSGSKDAVVFEVEFVEKQVDDSAQADQAPTTPIKTEDNADDFGSPFLETAKQTNVLLGALINEIQKLSAKMDGLVSQGSVSSDQNSDKETGTDSDAGKVAGAYARDRLEALHKRLQSLGV